MKRNNLPNAPTWTDQKIRGTSLSCVGPDETGRYKMNRIIGTPEAIERVPVGVRWAIESPHMQSVSISLDQVKTFQQSGQIESLTIERENTTTSNVF